ncbi:thiopeptide-type bacteriocin biosynthesis protein [Ktedonosporobacter rubrisoli]|uniref:thiopeptide-type bacteriocin biosynthesis protein n=1 Tax=Ktedonosporobacter rubrisoli TaxID=2509675 RepID=UPI0013EECE92|nr:thiopeptide-type bacteriocin biosynthesis protein [Ktedonosporobacter rubrisoli]
MNKEWISIHIFYYGDLNSLLVSCVQPLIESLREQSLIERYFFIRYWQEGLHIRLRLLPMDFADHDKIKYLAEQAISQFLIQRPALYKPNPQIYAPFQRYLFIAEYGREKLIETYGEHGSIPLRPNNSFAYIPYEPEYDRYGGVAGVDLAEWHFEYSSAMVLKLLTRINMTVPTIALGISFQLMQYYFFELFDTEEEIIQAIETYMKYWEKGRFAKNTKNVIDQSYKTRYEHMQTTLRHRVSQIRDYMLDSKLRQKATDVELEWSDHLHTFREKINAFIINNEQFDTISDRNIDLTHLRHKLLISYAHMTNNRIGTSIKQERYLAYLLFQALKDMRQPSTELMG